MNRVIGRIRGRSWFLWGVFSLSLMAVLLVLQVHRLLIPHGPVISAQIVTGTLLSVTIGWQWTLLWARQTRRTAQARRHYGLHRWIGIAAVVLFSVHAVRFGHAWTSVLATVFIAVAITGLLNREIMGYRQQWVYLTWLWVHMALSAALIPLIAVHVWVALAYQ